MRLACVIVILGAIAVGLVHLRRCEMAARHQMHQLQAAEVRLRRDFWDQQVRLGRLMSPGEVRRRAAALNLIESDQRLYRVARAGQ